MKTLNTFSLTVTFFFTVLIFLMLNIPEPLEQQYDALVKSLMEENEVTDGPEILKQFPELLEFKNQIQAVQEAHYQIQQVTQNPIPPGKRGSLQVLNQIKDLKTKNNILQTRQELLFLIVVSQFFAFFRSLYLLFKVFVTYYFIPCFSFKGIKSLSSLPEGGVQFVPTL